MVDLVLLAQAAQDRDRLLDSGLVHQHGLEAPLESRVLLNVLAVFVERGRADRVQFTARQHRLEEVGCVHGALCRAGSDNRVKLVDEEDHAPLGVLDLLEHGLEPLLELTAELGPRDERAQVQGDDTLVLEGLGDIPAYDALRQALDYGRLADAGLTDEHGIVLGTAAQDLDDAANLLVAADDRVQLAGPRLRREIATVLLQGRVRGLRVLAGHALPASDARERLQDGLLVGAVAIEKLLGVATAFGNRQKEMFCGDVLILETLGLVAGSLHRSLEPRISRQGTALNSGTFAEERGQFTPEGGHVRAEAAHRLRGYAVVRLYQGGEQVLGVQYGALEILGQALGVDYRFLGLLGEAVEIHELPLSSPVGRRLRVVPGAAGPTTSPCLCLGPWIGLNDVAQEVLGGLLLLALERGRKNHLDSSV